LKLNRTSILLNAPAIILEHNYPSGYLDPSKSDIAFTNKVVECGKLLGIEVLNQIIIGENNVVNMKQNNDMYSCLELCNMVSKSPVF
jgi:DNA repair protein RadC